VHAFVTSVQLMNAADELLPLTANGQPALPADTLAGQEAEVQALLLAATAYHMAPDVLVWAGLQQKRLGQYCRRRLSLVGGSWEAAYSPALQPLGGLLLKLVFTQSPVSPEQSLRVARAAARQAQSAADTISRQMQQLQSSSGQQVLTAAQLEAALHRITIISAAGVLKVYARQHVAPQEVRSVADALVVGSERLLVLEPHSPHALHMAARGFINLESSSSSSSAAQSAVQRGLCCLMAAFRAAEAAHSPYWKVRSGSRALMLAAAPMMAVSNSDLAALIAAAEEAPAAVRQLRRVVPQSWVAILQETVDAATRLLPAARLRLHGGSGTAGQQWAAATAGIEQHAAALKQATAQVGCTCSGCGQRALGLQRCARCKKAACEWGGVDAGDVLRRYGVVCADEESCAACCGQQPTVHRRVLSQCFTDQRCLPSLLSSCADCSRDCQVRTPQDCGWLVWSHMATVCAPAFRIVRTITLINAITALGAKQHPFPPTHRRCATGRSTSASVPPARAAAAAPEHGWQQHGGPLSWAPAGALWRLPCLVLSDGCCLGSMQLNPHLC